MQKTNTTVKVGDKVMHKKTRHIRRIEIILDDVSGGVVLDRETDGFRYWNIADLKVIPTTTKKSTRT